MSVFMVNHNCLRISESRIGLHWAELKQLTCRTHIVEHGVCPYFGVDRFDKGGHLEDCWVSDVELFSGHFR